MLKIGIVGLGDIAQVHIQAIDDNPEAQLVAVCDEIELFKNKVPHAHFYKDLNEMLDSEALDCVHI